MMKLKIYTTLIVVLVYKMIFSQNISVKEMWTIVSFNQYLGNAKSPVYYYNDTVDDLLTLVNYFYEYDKHNKEKYLGSTCYIDLYLGHSYGILKGNDEKISCDTILYDLKDRTKFFSLLFYIENKILKSKDTLVKIKVNESNGVTWLLTGEIDISKIYSKELYKEELQVYYKEEKELKKIYKLYVKWLKLAKKIGLEKIKTENIRPLDNTKYTWVKNS